MDSEEGSARETTMNVNTHGEKRMAKPDPGSQDRQSDREAEREGRTEAMSEHPWSEKVGLSQVFCLHNRSLALLSGSRKRSEIMGRA